MRPGDNGPVMDYRAVFERRRWSLIIPIVLGLGAGIALAVLLPREYVASATLAVTSPSVAGNLATPTQADQAERIRAVSHELLSQAVLEQVARDERLLDTAPLEVVVADIRKRTTLSVPQKSLSSTNRLEPDTFIVAYTGRTPELAQRVANRLTQAFVDSHSKLRETRAEDTSAFLARQLELSQGKLSAAETRLREAKATYQGRLPEQGMANLQGVTDARQQIDSQEMALRTERGRVTMLDQQIQGMQEDARAAAVTAAESKTKDRVATLEQQLAEARLQYTARHPEVQRLEGDLARARAEDADARRQAGSATVMGGIDPALRPLIAERESARLRILELQGATARARGDLSASQGRLNEAPVIEQRLMSLSQAYEFEKQQYQKLAEQYQSALLAEDLERKQAGERFIVLYAAERPAYPTSPNIPLVVAVGLLAGVALGGGLAVARELLDRSVHDRQSLEAQFDRVVLAEIPRF